MADLLLPRLIPGEVACREGEPFGNLQRRQGKGFAKCLNRFLYCGPTFLRYHRELVPLAREYQPGSIVTAPASLEQLGVGLRIRAQAVNLGHNSALERLVGGPACFFTCPLRTGTRRGTQADGESAPH